MTVYTAFLFAGLALAALGLALAAAIVLQRGLRQHSGRRDLALVEPFRPLLIALVMDDHVDAAATAQILGADDRAWSALEPHIISMVRKLRGDSRAVLVNLLDERGTITRLNRRLKRPGAVGRARAAELLGLLGEHAPRRDLERLALRDHDAEVRIVAARALGEIGDPMSARALLAAASGPRAVPLRIAARSLARLGPGAAPELMRGLRSDKTTSRAVSAEILGLLGVTAAATALAGAADDDAELDVRIRSARALGRIGVPSALPVLERCTGPDHHPALRAVAARAVGEVGGPIAIELLARLMDDPTHRVASNAARALGRLGDRALPVLRRTAAGPTPGAPYAAEVLAELDVRSGRVVTLRADADVSGSDGREPAVIGARR